MAAGATIQHRGLLGAAPLIPYVAVILGVHVLSSAWASILAYHAGILLVLSISRGWRLGPAPRSRRSLIALVILIVGAALVGPVVYGLWPTMRLDGLAIESELAGLGLTGAVWAAFIVYYFTVNPVLEEMFWRGALGSESVRPAVNDGWFAGYHLLVLIEFVAAPWVVLGFLGLLATAWFWRQLVREFGGLAIPIVSHAAADASLILAIHALAS